MPNPAWFNEDQYLSNKVAQLNAIAYQDNSNWTTQEVLAAFGSMTPYDHWVAYGNAENISPNDYFNVSEYMVAKANQLNSISYEDRTDWTAQDVAEAFKAGNISAWDHYIKFGAAEGINASNQFDTDAYVSTKADVTGQTTAQVLAAMQAEGINPVEDYYLHGEELDVLPTAVPAADQVTVPADFNPWIDDVPGPGPDVPVNPDPFYLTVDLDAINGTDMSDTFIAQEFDGVNTLQTGDRISGGAGTDIIYADVTAGNTFGQMLNAVRPQLQEVEIVKFTSQQSTDYHDNVQGSAGIRADRISGMSELWSSDSRATLHVDDVRIDSNKMLEGWQNADNCADAGQNLSYLVHFNNQYLRAGTQSTSGELVLELIDSQGALEGRPLNLNPYNEIRFDYDGRLINLNFGTVDGDADYGQLLAAIQAAIVATPGAAGLTAELGSQFQQYDGLTGQPVYGYSIIIKANAPLTLGAGSGWFAEGVQNPDSSVNATMHTETETDCPLIRTDIALDNVGMVEWNDVNNCIPNNQQFGDYAGTMEVGGMGNGKYVGIQRFDVHVDRGSWLAHLQSTNDALRAVLVDNAVDYNGDGHIGQTPTVSGAASQADSGNLFIGEGQRLSNNGTNIIRFEKDNIDSDVYHNQTVPVWLKAMADGHYIFEGRDGLLNATYEQFAYKTSPDATQTFPVTVKNAGLQDVMVFDASAMDGKANISAIVTDLSSDKYYGDTDEVQGLGRFSPKSGFQYYFGSNDDTLNMIIDGNVAADNDYKMDINMGNGDNSVRTEFSVLGNNTNWQWNQYNNTNGNTLATTITSGTGDDIINPYGNGRVEVFTGAGDDVVYSDNSGINVTADSVARAAGTGHIPGVGAIWALNFGDAAGTVTGDPARAVAVRNGEIVPVQNSIVSQYASFNGTVTGHNAGTVTLKVVVSYKGISNDATLNLNVRPVSATSQDGTVSVSDLQANQLILDAVNSDSSWLSSVMTAKEGAGHSLLLISKVDGYHASVDDLRIDFTATYNGTNNESVTLSNPTLSTDLTTWYNATYKDWAMQEVKDATDPTAAPTYNAIQGEDSLAQADNITHLGQDANADLLVMGTGAQSNDTYMLEGINDTIVNFQFSGDGQDYINVASVIGSTANVQVAGNGSAGAVTMAGIGSAITANNAKAVVLVQNEAVKATDYVNTAAKLQQAILDSVNNNAETLPHNATILYMVYDQDGPRASRPIFTLYKGEFGANGAPTVSALGGNLTFAEMRDDSGNPYYDMSDFMSKIQTSSFVASNNGPTYLGPGEVDVPGLTLFNPVTDESAAETTPNDPTETTPEDTQVELLGLDPLTLDMPVGE